MEIAMHCN